MTLKVVFKQCDQIELFLKGLDENPSYKRSPKICNFLDDFENIAFK